MRLSDLIIKNLEPILQAWEDFARTIEVPGEALDSKALRGLGLYIASEMVAAHSGTLDVTSDRARGTTFLVKVPVGKSQSTGEATSTNFFRRFCSYISWSASVMAELILLEALAMAKPTEALTPNS